LLSTEGVGNAFFYKPKSKQEALNFARQTARVPDHTPGIKRYDQTITGAYDDKVKRLLRYGTIVADSDAGAPTIAHEAGHAKIEETPGILRALQRHVYPHARWMSPLAGAGSMAAGLASGSTLKGALLGTGIGALAGGGMVAPEIGASYYALKHLKGLGDGSLTAEGRKDLISALSTYLAATVLPSTLAGAAGGWISGRRKKREEEDEEQEKAASTEEEQALLLEADADPMIAGYVKPEVADVERRWIYTGDGQLAGFFTPRKSNGALRTGAIYVKPEFRGQGLASKAIADYVGDSPARAFIETGNAASRKAFARAGFQETDPEERWGGGHWFRKNEAAKAEQEKSAAKWRSVGNPLGSRLDNIMRTTDGRAVISDPRFRYLGRTAEPFSKSAARAMDRIFPLL